MRYACIIQYCGKRYHGWQRQPGQTTIQSVVEQALCQMLSSDLEVVGSGRTDTGVHASGQVAHFNTTQSITGDFLYQINKLLPSDINISCFMRVSDNFHARYSATNRCYRYLIYNNHTPSSCWYDFSKHVHGPLSVANMHAAAQQLVGKHDFSAIRGSQCQSHSPVRKVKSAVVWRQDDFIIFEVQADAFLHHMVRNIMGILLPIGKQQRPVRWLKDVIASRDRTKAGITCSAEGLYLHRVSYEQHQEFNLRPQKYIIDYLS